MRIYHFTRKKKNGKVEKLICGIEKHVIHIRALQQALNHGLKLKKIERVIQFNQGAWLKHILTWILEKEEKQKMNLKKFF